MRDCECDVYYCDPPLAPRQEQTRTLGRHIFCFTAKLVAKVSGWLILYVCGYVFAALASQRIGNCFQIRISLGCCEIERTRLVQDVSSLLERPEVELISCGTALAQQAFASDPKYKKYTQQVERCLNSFDNVHEWADCIAFLKQLLKVSSSHSLWNLILDFCVSQTFQSYMQFKEIPRKLIVAKRLAQCLNPALPTGVHQRALDVYSHILAVLGVSAIYTIHFGRGGDWEPLVGRLEAGFATMVIRSIPVF